jgi:predicted AAA+ superfamily ATPase
LTTDVSGSSYAFGEAFETWIIQECYRLNEYFKKDFRLSYLRTQADVEIDLIMERPGRPDLLVEIKSGDFIREDDVRSLARLAADWDRPYEAQLWSQDVQEKTILGVKCLPWRNGLQQTFM